MYTMKDCHDLHLTLMFYYWLVFETFKKESINSFGLDLAHHLSTAGNSWDARLRFTHINLKLI